MAPGSLLVVLKIYNTSLFRLGMVWNLYDGDNFLQPMCFSNGKNQEDIVKEVLDAVKEGHKVIFIHGVCGTMSFS
jgi:hypothetical protein